MSTIANIKTTVEEAHHMARKTASSIEDVVNLTNIEIGRIIDSLETAAVNAPDEQRDRLQMIVENLNQARKSVNQLNEMGIDGVRVDLMKLLETLASL